MKNGVTIWRLPNLLEQAFTNVVRINGEWLPNRPLGRTDIKQRLRAAWLVFTGKADAVVWPDKS